MEFSEIALHTAYIIIIIISTRCTFVSRDYYRARVIPARTHRDAVRHVYVGTRANGGSWIIYAYSGIAVSEKRISVFIRRVV